MAIPEVARLEIEGDRVLAGDRRRVAVVAIRAQECVEVERAAADTGRSVTARGHGFGAVAWHCRQAAGPENRIGHVRGRERSRRRHVEPLGHRRQLSTPRGSRVGEAAIQHASRRCPEAGLHPGGRPLFMGLSLAGRVN